MMQTYDPKKVKVLFLGAPLDGFADGTFVNVSRNEDGFSLVVCESLSALAGPA